MESSPTSIAEPCNLMGTWTSYATSPTDSHSNTQASPNSQRDFHNPSTESNPGDTTMSGYVQTHGHEMNSGAGSFMSQETPVLQPPLDYARARLPPRRRRVYNQLSVQQERVFLNQALDGAHATYYAPATAMGPPSNRMGTQMNGLQSGGVMALQDPNPTPMEPRTSHQGPVAQPHYSPLASRTLPQTQGFVSNGSVHGPSQPQLQQPQTIARMPYPVSVALPRSSVPTTAVPMTVPTWTPQYAAAVRPLQPQPQPQQQQQQQQRHDEWPPWEPSPRPVAALPARTPQLTAYGRLPPGMVNGAVAMHPPPNPQARASELRRSQLMHMMQRSPPNPVDARATQEYAHSLSRNQRLRQPQGASTNPPLQPEKSLDNQRNGRPDPKESEELSVNLECKVCFTQLVDTVLLPCGHAVLCQWCADTHLPSCRNNPTRLEGDPSCPICRGPVRHKVSQIDG